MELEHHEENKIEKLRCANCNSDNIQFVSEYTELERKTPGIVLFLNIISSILLAIATPLFIVSLPNLGKIDFKLIPTGIAFLYLIGIALLIYIFSCLIKVLQPYQHKTYLRAVCKYCGSSWRISVEDKSLNKEKNEQ
ncbi:MAG: hypothetical protein IKB30_02255 [Clostridia bacterium]|nr:hypothetical protein [Clostridia bacterium]